MRIASSLLRTVQRLSRDRGARRHSNSLYKQQDVEDGDDDGTE
jgi:hypothetical protein